MERRKRALIITLGCKVNRYESEYFAEELSKHGFDVAFSDDDGTDSPEEYHVCIINTCSITAEADRKSRQMVRRAIAACPGARVYVTGCAAQASPQTFEGIAGVSAVIGNATKKETVRLAACDAPRNGQPTALGCDLDGAEFEPMSISSFKRARAYIKIEDGCESKCAYCIVPSVRGRIRSKPRDEVRKEARALTAGGCSELVLTGIETSAYQYGLCELLREIDPTEGLGRIRLGSLDPSMMKQDFVDAYASCLHTMPHFHLSMQSGCDRTLARMRRKYNTGSALKKIEYIRSVIPKVQFSADVICGFPGETDEDFRETVRFFEQARFLHLHVFPYSVRPGTEAASMPDRVPRDIARARTAELIAVQKRIRREILEGLIAENESLSILIETAHKKEDGTVTLTGHTPEFAEVRAEADACVLSRMTGIPEVTPEALRGRIVSVFPTGTDGAVISAHVPKIPKNKHELLKKRSHRFKLTVIIL